LRVRGGRNDKPWIIKGGLCAKLKGEREVFPGWAPFSRGGRRGERLRSSSGEENTSRLGEKEGLEWDILEYASVLGESGANLVRLTSGAKALEGGTESQREERTAEGTKRYLKNQRDESRARSWIRRSVKKKGRSAAMPRKSAKTRV